MIKEAIKKRLLGREELKTLQKKQEDTFMLVHEQEEREEEQCQEQDTARQIMACRGINETGVSFANL